MTLFGHHVHKMKRGYYVNHDTLMSLDPAARQRVMTYFIARNTPWKLDPQDRYLIEDQFKNNHVTNLVYVAATGATLGLLLARRFNLAVSLFSASFLYNYTENRRERDYIITSPLVKDVALKYNFSIFDFQNSKKESQLEMLRDLIQEEARIIRTGIE